MGWLCVGAAPLLWRAGAVAEGLGGALAETPALRPTLLNLDQPIGLVIMAGLLVLLLFAALFFTLFGLKMRKKNLELIGIQKSLNSAEEVLKKENEVREIKDRLLQTIDSAPVLYIMTQLGRIIETNAYCQVQLDVHPGDSLDRLFIEHDHQQRLMKELDERGRVGSQIAHIRVSECEDRRFLITLTRVAVDRAPAAIIWGVDVERMESQRDLLAHARSDLSRALQTIPEAVVIYDTVENKLVLANDEFLNMFGFASLEEARTVDVRDALQQNKALNQGVPDLMDQLRECLDSGKTYSLEWVWRLRGGGSFPTQLFASGVEFDQRPCVIVTIKDITLERERTEALTRIAEKEKEANQLKSRFLMNMSHEIRTPMNAIIGFSQIALRKPQTLENVDTFKKIYMSAQNLLSIMGDILDFSKIEAQKLDLNYAEFSIEDMIQNAFTIAAQRIADKKVEMLLDIRQDVPYYIIGDKTRVWQVLKNLLDNAAKFTEQGHVVLSVETVEGASNDRDVSIRFTVRDTGIGMSREQLERLFSPFEQFTIVKNDTNSGTGLGMPIIQQLLNLMNGTIDVTSEPGVGTTIQVVIPFRRSEKSTTLKNVVGEKNIRTNSVLIADDDEYACLIMKNLLALLGIEPVIVNNGADAIAKVKEYENNGTPFKIIILDYMLGSDNGLEIARRMKNITVNQSKLLMISAYTKQLLDEEIQDIGFTDVIEKPFVPSQFIQSLSNSIEADLDVEKRRFKQFKGARVLLCEDNIINQEVGKGVLEVFSIEPDIAENGSVGLAMLDAAEQPYDLVFMDIMMPIMDGHETTVAIRGSSKPYHDVPIVAMTASVIKEEVEKCQKEGMNGHIAKPLSLEDVYQALCDHLSKYMQEPQIEPVYNPQDLSKVFEWHGIDFKNGVQRFGGKQERYLQTLKKFAESLDEEQPPMSVAFDEFHHEESARVVHTLKGTAGNLGVTSLYDAAVAFEKTYRAGLPDMMLYDALWAECKKAKRAVLSIVREEQRQRDLIQGEDKELMESLRDLLKALEMGEAAQCETIMKNLSGSQFKSANPKDMERLNALVEGYEFMEAEELAEQMLEAIK